MDVFCNAMLLVPHDAGSLGVGVDEVFSDGKSGGADTPPPRRRAAGVARRSTTPPLLTGTRRGRTSSTPYARPSTEVLPERIIESIDYINHELNLVGFGILRG